MRYRNRYSFGEYSGNLLTNGDFETGDFTGWDEHTAGSSIVGNACQINHTGVNIYLGQDFGAVFGRIYNITYEIMANTGIAGGQFKLSGGGAFTGITIPSTVGSHSLSLEVTNALPTWDLRFIVINTDPGDTITVDNISIRTADQGIFFLGRR